MSATSALESNEELENIPLVRMEDVQPDRSEKYIVNSKKPVDAYDDEDDSNIGSVVSVQSEEAIGVEESDGAELIVPEVLPNTRSVPLTIIVERTELKQNPDSWPTLEILPGGVIKNADKHNLSSLYHSGPEDEQDIDLMYACAKCPQRFKYLFCLVKHVKWHEDQKKKDKAPDLCTKKVTDKKIISLHPNKKKVLSKLKTKCKVPKKS